MYMNNILLNRIIELNLYLNVTLHSHRGMWRDPDEVLNQKRGYPRPHIDAISYSLSHTFFRLTLYNYQKSKVTCIWKIIFFECHPVGRQGRVHRDPNAIAAQRAACFFFFFFFKHMSKDAGW